MSKPTLRGTTYWIMTTINGVRIRESLKTSDPKEAQQLYDERRASAWRRIVLKERPKKTFKDACDRWLKERGHKKSLQDDKDKIDYLQPKIGAKLLPDLDRDTIEAVLPQDVKPATRNRYRALIRSILRACEREWDWLDKSPAMRTEQEPRRRVAFLTREQAEALIAALPEKYRCPVRFALLTGLRKSNVFGLRWENVNLERGMVVVHEDEAKAGERILVPLNSQAKAMLEAMPEPRQGLVFQCPSRISPTTWANATKLVGVPWARFHDLRHTWASWHAMAGTPLSVLQELGGWHSAEMVRKYAHLSPEHLAAAAEKVTL
jgi:integrase